jgi:hypothetical protein
MTPQPTPSMVFGGCFQEKTGQRMAVFESTRLSGWMQKGILTYANGRFASQIMKRDRTDEPETNGAWIGENNTGAGGGYDANFDTYSVDEDSGEFSRRLERWLLRTYRGRLAPDCSLGPTSSYVSDARAPELARIQEGFVYS